MARGKLLTLIAFSIVGLALAGRPALAQDKAKLAEVTKSDLNSKIPNFFSFGPRRPGQR